VGGTLNVTLQTLPVAVICKLQPSW
jgi:hypothetical protein